jgi:hypothetical protein
MFEKFGPELNACPNVDFRVFMDMQLQALATHPGWRGIYGVQNYLSSHMTEETVRWVSRLFRHYCIEGKTELLSEAQGLKFHLNYIQSPDFEEGTFGYWDLSNARTMKAMIVPGFSWKQGRYDVDTHADIPRGNNVLWMKRGKDKPNVLSQEIRNLERGKLYSVKLYAADYKDFAKKQSVNVSLNVEKADLLPEKDHQGLLRQLLPRLPGPGKDRTPRHLRLADPEEARRLARAGDRHQLHRDPAVHEVN